MRGYFQYLRFKTFPTTPRTPQCEVFWALLSSSKHLGVPADSKPPTFPSVGLHPHTWPKWGCDTGPQYKKYVLTKLFADPTLVDLVLESKLIMVQQEIISGFIKTLTSVKNPCSSTKLATKHALLVTTINNVNIFSSMR